MASLPFPERGFYRHYKHDSSKDWNNYHYEVVASAWHTEDGNHLVIYRPLYGDCAYLGGADYAARPLSMFMDEVTKEGKTFPRFTKVTDAAIIEKLIAKRKELYGE